MRYHEYFGYVGAEIGNGWRQNCRVDVGMYIALVLSQEEEDEEG